MVKILHLYPNLMNLYGDYANVTVLKKHLEDQGLKVCIDTVELGQKIRFNNYDFIYMGSGTESNLIEALYGIMEYKDAFKKCVDDGKTILFTGNAMELLGSFIDNQEALGVFDFEVKHTDKRYTGDVILKNDDFGFVVGFINRSTLISGGEQHKLFNYIFMDNNLQDNAYEGCHINNLYGTHVIGPVLVKNPDFMNTIVSSLLPKGKKLKYVKYEYEVDSFIVTLNALKDRIK